MINLRNATRTRRLAVHTALAAALVAGCAGIGQLALAESGPRSADKAASRTVAVAEKAVAKNPQDAGLRAALGRAYLAAGRFESAADAFGDASQLGDTSASVALSFALARIGEGRMNDALATLGQNRDAIPASDYGLALALAGETGRGVAVLEDALRGGENTAKLRQNLAYAYALDGRWREARAAAAQDVPLAQVGDRMSAWAAQARPEDYRVRVASLLGVPVRADIGQPEALALAPRGDAPQVAVVDPVPAAAGNGAELPALDGTPGAAPAQVAMAAPSEPTPVPATVETSGAFATAFTAPRSYVSEPVVQAVPAPRMASLSVPVIAAPAAPARAAPRARLQRAALTVASASPLAAADCTHLVQLGSFSSEARARQAWSIYIASNPELRSYKMTITPAVVKGRNYWRVAASGLNSSRAAGLCSAVRGRGGACFAYAVARPWPGAAPGLNTGAGAPMKARRR